MKWVKKFWGYKRLLRIPFLLLIIIYSFTFLLLINEYIGIVYLGLGDQYPWGWQGAANYASQEVYLASILKSIVLCAFILTSIGVFWRKFLRRDV